MLGESLTLPSSLFWQQMNLDRFRNQSETQLDILSISSWNVQFRIGKIKVKHIEFDSEQAELQVQ